MTSSPDRRAARPPAAIVLLLAAALLLGCGGSDDGGAGTTTTQDTASRQPATITGGTSKLEIDSAVDGALSVGGVTIGAAGAAEKRDGAYAFPIEQGRLGTGSVSGMAAHGGGLRLETAGRTVVIRDLLIDLDERVVSGTVENRQIPVMKIAPGSGQVERSGGRVTVSGLEASLTQEAANLVNGRSDVEGPLGNDLIGEGQTVGQLTIEGQTG